MIISTGDKLHPKAEVLLIDFKRGTVDFRWLEEDESPSKIYSGDCMTHAVVTSFETAEKEIGDAVKAEIAKVG